MKLGTTMKILAALAGVAVVATGRNIVAGGQTDPKIDTHDSSTLGLCSSPSVLSLCETSPFPSHLPYSAPKVTEESIRNLVLGGSETEISATAKLFMEAHELHPVIGDYFDLVFTHLSGFNIIHYPEQEFLNEGTSYAMYFPASRTLALPPTPSLSNSVSYFKYLSAIRHEMRHAAMHATQLTLNQEDPKYSECFYPVSPEEKAKIEYMIRKGDDRVNKLEELLTREANNKITTKEQDYLKKLWDDSHEMYQHYKVFTSFSISDHEFAQRERQLGKKLEAGSTFLEDFGPVTLVSVETGSTPNTKTILCSLDDPLQAVVQKIKINKSILATQYDKNSYTYELDAHLHGGIPQPLIKALYSEFYEYTHNLISTARQQQKIPNRHPLTERVSLRDIMIKGLVFNFKNPHFYQAEDAQFYLDNAKVAFDAGYRTEAKMGLNTLIKNGHHVHKAKFKLALFDIREGNLEQAKTNLKSLIEKKCPAPTKGEANLYLARLEYLDRNYKDAVKYFRRAKRENATLTQTDHAYNSTAFLEEERYKQAEKAAKQAGNPPPRMRL